MPIFERTFKPWSLHRPLLKALGMVQQGGAKHWFTQDSKPTKNHILGRLSPTLDGGVPRNDQHPARPDASANLPSFWSTARVLAVYEIDHSKVWSPKNSALLEEIQIKVVLKSSNRSVPTAQHNRVPPYNSFSRSAKTSDNELTLWSVPCGSLRPNLELRARLGSRHSSLVF